MNATPEIPSQAGAIWAWVPLGLLLCMSFGIGTLAFIAIDDPNFALEPDYYAKALHWDQAQAQGRESEALGYDLRLRQPLFVSTRGRVEVELELKDRKASGISGAVVEITAFPNAFAGRIEHVVMHEVAPGVYRGELGHGMAGLWELRCAVAVGSSRYARALRVDVGKGRPA